MAGLRISGAAVAPPVVVVSGAFMIFFIITTRMVDIHAVTARQEESQETFQLSAPTTPESKAAGTAGFTGPLGELFDEMLEAVAKLQDEESTARASSSSSSSKKPAPQDFYEEMKEKLWVLNEERIVQKLIEDGILEPSYGDKYKLNYVPTYMEEDLFTGIFSSEEEEEEHTPYDAEKKEAEEKKKTRVHQKKKAKEFLS